MEMVEVYAQYGIFGVIAFGAIYWASEQFKQGKASQKKLDDTVDALQAEIRQMHQREIQNIQTEKAFREKIIIDMQLQAENILEQNDKILFDFQENQKIFQKWQKI